jgi:hypothetical protein
MKSDSLNSITYCHQIYVDLSLLAWRHSDLLGLMISVDYVKLILMCLLLPRKHLRHAVHLSVVYLCARLIAVLFVCLCPVCPFGISSLSLSLFFVPWCSLFYLRRSLVVIALTPCHMGQLGPNILHRWGGALHAHRCSSRRQLPREERMWRRWRKRLTDGSPSSPISWRLCSRWPFWSLLIYELMNRAGLSGYASSCWVRVHGPAMLLYCETCYNIEESNG